MLDEKDFTTCLQAQLAQHPGGVTLSQLLEQFPGVPRRTAQRRLAEIG